MTSYLTHNFEDIQASSFTKRLLQTIRVIYPYSSVPCFAKNENFLPLHSILFEINFDLFFDNFINNGYHFQVGSQLHGLFNINLDLRPYNLLTKQLFHRHYQNFWEISSIFKIFVVRNGLETLLISTIGSNFESISTFGNAIFIKTNQKL